MATHGLPAWPWTDTGPDSLAAPEALLLEAMRRWACASRGGRPALAAARLPLIAESVGEAAHPLDAVLRGGEFAIACPLAPRFTQDEPALLLAFALAQRGPRREALAAFLRLLPPAGAYAAMGPALGLGLAFRRAGLLFGNPLKVG